MAKKFYVAINLLGNELQNAVIQNLSAEPSAIAGQIFYDTDDLRIKMYNGTAFKKLLTEDDAGTNAVTRASGAGASNEIIVSAGADRTAQSFASAGGIPKLSASGVISIATADVDYTTKAYVDNRVFNGLSYRLPVDLAFNDAVNPLPLVDSTKIDNVTVTTGMRVLVLDSNTAGQDNKIYSAVVTTGNIVWTVQQDGTGADLPTDGDTVWVKSGDTYADQRWTFGGTLWVQSSGSGSIPDATTSVKGKVELATQAEAQAKSSTTVVTTPASLADFARKFSTTFNNSSDWVGGAAPYTITVTNAIHGLGAVATLLAQVRELSGSDYNLVDLDIQYQADGDVVISSNAKFTGSYVILG